MKKTNENRELYLAEQFVKHTSRNIFLTGKAGTGKTTLLKDITDSIDKNTVVVAPTGVAAINAGGVTIHSFFQLPLASFIPVLESISSESIMDRRTLAKQHRMRGDKRKLINELELLIIDEISMVRADLLDAVDYILRRIRKNEHPFGGIQLLLIGDLFQLSPVVNNNTWDVLRQYYKSPFFFDALVWQNNNALTIELQKVYRQEDISFINLLNHIRQGDVVESDFAMLNERYTSDISKREIITLTTHNAKADKINNEELQSLKGEKYLLEADISGKFSENAFPIPKEIEVKKGAKVMFIRNHSESLYFNGKIGTVTGMYEDMLFVQCDDQPDPIAVSPSEWTNNRYAVDEDTKEIKIEEIGTYRQYPIRLAWAVTVHKSQGLTFDEVILDLKDTFAPGQLYVALSRCRSIEGLTLSSHITADNIKIDHRISDFYDRFVLSTDIDKELTEAKKSYDQQKMIKVFNVDKLQAHTEIWEQSIRENNSPQQNSFLKTAVALLQELEGIQKTAEKFKNQLWSIIQKINSGEDKEELLIQRITLAIDYFNDQLHTHGVTPLENRYNDFKKAKTSVLIKNLSSLISEFWRHIDALYNIKYLDKKVYYAKRKYKQVIIFDPKKNPIKREKGLTYEETFNLWKEGINVEQIAKKRGLAQGTIEGHLSQLLKDDKVDIKELMKSDRIDKIYSQIVENSKLSLNDLKAKIPFYTSYAELRWMLIWYQKNAIDLM